MGFKWVTMLILPCLVGLVLFDVVAKLSGFDHQVIVINPDELVEYIRIFLDKADEVPFGHGFAKAWTAATSLFRIRPGR